MSIDPGLYGGIALLNMVTSKPRLQGLYDTPLKKTDGKNHIDVSVLNRMVKETKPNVFVLESLLKMASKGAYALISAGLNLGIWSTLSSVYNTPLETVHPKTWQSGMLGKLDGGRPAYKEASVIEAQRLFPSNKKDFVTKQGRKLDGRADAVLVGYYWATHIMTVGKEQPA